MMSSGGSTGNNAPRYPTPIQRPTAPTGNMQQHPPPPMHSSGPPGAPVGGLGARPRAPNPHPARIPGSGSAPGHPSQMKSNASNSYAMTANQQHDKSTPASSSNASSTPTTATTSASTATSSADDKPQRKGGNNASDASTKPGSSESSNKDSSAKADGSVASAAK
jgi:hypothetical protein